jgi:hypothetical protein
MSLLHFPNSNTAAAKLSEGQQVRRRAFLGAGFIPRLIIVELSLHSIDYADASQEHAHHMCCRAV